MHTKLYHISMGAPYAKATYNLQGTISKDPQILALCKGKRLFKIKYAKK